MATQVPVKPLTRDQLAKIAGGNQEIIRRLEQLFSLAGTESPDEIVVLFRLVQETAIDAANALAAANQAQAVLQATVEQLGIVLKMPPPEVLPLPDDLTPPIQIGTLAYQNADSVEVGSLAATGDVDAVNLNASGDVGAVNVNASGDVGAVNVNATGNVEAVSYSVNGNAGASGTGAAITAITVENGIVTAITVT